MTKPCIFCKIAKHQEKKEIIFENKQIIVFEDLYPQAQVHLQIIPKKHIESINHLEEQDRELISQMIFLAKELAVKQGIVKTGYRLFFNVGRGGGQIIDHLHLHMIGGGDLPL